MPENDQGDLRSRVEQLLLAEDSWGIVRELVTELGPQAVSLVIDEIRRGTHDTKFTERALLALGELGGSEAENFVVSMLDQPDQMIKAAALTALRQIGKEEHAPAVAQLLNDTSDTVRKEAIKTLAEIGSSAHLDSLKTLAQSEEKGFLKEQAQRAVAEIEKRNV